LTEDGEVKFLQFYSFLEGILNEWLTRDFTNNWHFIKEIENHYRSIINYNSEKNTRSIIASEIMNPSPSIDNDLSWMIMMINLLFIIAYVIWIRRSLNYIYSNKLMKHTIYENEFAPMMKKHTNPNTASNPRRATVHFNTTPETTPVKFRK
jgi:hypothetical protein